jgi:hypothetical protein
VRIQSISVVPDLARGRVETLCGRLIDEIMPVTVERCDCTVVDSYKQSLERMLGKPYGGERPADKKKKRAKTAYAFQHDD